MTFRRPSCPIETPPHQTPLEYAETYTLSQLCRAFGLSARALRYYDERRLIEAQRDRLNRRVFGPAARERLEIICPLRRASVPLEMIADMLSGSDAVPAERVAEVLQDQLSALSRQVSVVQALVRQTQARARRRHLREV